MWLQERTGGRILRLHIDGGEALTSRITAKLREQGTEVVINLADVHSNTTIERRNKDVGGISNAKMHYGQAPAKLWEFSVRGPRPGCSSRS
jgi:hypothetical protein